MGGEGMAALPQDVTYDGVDVEFLRRKYTEERAKRLNPKGNSQYVEVTGDFSRYIDDPYVDGPLVRDAVDETVEALVIGGGFGGLLAAAELHKIGVTDIRIVEKRSEEHTSELQSLMRISYAVFCLKKKKNINNIKSFNHKNGD